MSFDALAWAAKASGLRPAEKLVLLGLAECADRHTCEAHPSVAALIEFSGLNRKTVIAALDALALASLIAETGELVGRTRQIKVYRLNLETVPKVERSQKRNSSTFSAKQSQKRDTDTVKEPVAQKATLSSLSREKPIKRSDYHRLPEGWVPTRPFPPRLAAKIAQWPPGEFEDQLDALRRWAANAKDEPGKGRKLDWDQACHNWMDKHDAERKPARQPYPGQTPGIGRTIGAAQSVIADIRAARAGAR